MRFRIEKACEHDISDVVRIILSVYASMPEAQKEWFAVDEEDYTREMLTNGTGRAYKAVEEESGETAGILTVIVPGLKEFNLGYDIGLKQEELMQVVHMDTAAVLPSYRGYGLQNRLIEFAEKELQKDGYSILCCTAHPENAYSRDNILKQGYQIMLTKEKYGGLLRHIFMKRI